MHERVAPLRLCTVVTTEGETIQPFVRCVRRDKTIDALTCTGCARMRALEWQPGVGGSVTCATEEAPPPPMDRRADLSEAASRVLLHEVVSPITTCITAELSVHQAKHLIAERGLRSVAIVDANGKLQGLVSRSDLMNVDLGCVADVMPPRVHALPESAPIGYAIALMAFEDVNEVPVVAEDGQVIGIYRALDALRWVAGRMGYVTPVKDAVAKDPTDPTDPKKDPKVE